MAVSQEMQEALDTENSRHRSRMVEIREEYEAAKTAEEGQHFLNVKEIREADSS